MPRIKIGTRGSPLALIQARETRDRLIAAHGLDPSDIEIVSITTTGDRIKDRPLNEIGGKGLFTKEIEEALLAGEIQLAVHSMKDLPANLPSGLTMAAILPREDPQGCLHESRCQFPGRTQNGRHHRLLLGSPHSTGVKTAA